QGGSGVPGDPLRIHGPEHFDRLLHEIDLRHTEVREVLMYPGSYWTRGAWAQPTYRVGRPFRLAGIDPHDPAEIMLAPDARFETGGESRPDIVVLRLGEAFRNNHT